MDQSEIFIREKQYDFTTDSGLFTPPDTIRKVLNVIGILSEQMDHLWLFQNSIAFKLVKKMIHATTPPPPPPPKKKKKKKISHSFLEGKCHPLLYVTVALNLYANIYLHHHIKGWIKHFHCSSKSARKGNTKIFYYWISLIQAFYYLFINLI